jgi:type II secretory pathway component PulF
MGDRLVEIQANRLTRLAAMLEPVGVILIALTTAVFLFGIYQTLFGLAGAIPFGD